MTLLCPSILLEAEGTRGLLWLLAPERAQKPNAYSPSYVAIQSSLAFCVGCVTHASRAARSWAFRMMGIESYSAALRLKQLWKRATPPTPRERALQRSRLPRGKTSSRCERLAGGFQTRPCEFTWILWEQHPLLSSTNCRAVSTSSSTLPLTFSSICPVLLPSSEQKTMAHFPTRSSGTRGMLRGIDGNWYNEWDFNDGPLPEGYPTRKKGRTNTPPPLTQVQGTVPELPSQASEDRAMKKAMASMLKGVGAEVRKAAVEARGEGAPKRKAGKPLTRRRWSCPFRWPKLGPLLWFLGPIFLVTMFSEPSLLKEMSRTAGAVANAAEGAGSLAGAVTHAAANATVAVTSTAAGIASTSLTLAREAWVGVDLLNVSANRSHGRVIADDLHVVKVWAGTHPSFANVELDVDAVFGPAEALSPALPLAEWCDSFVDINGGRWIAWRVWTRRLHGGQLAVAFEVSTVMFTARWSNPLWEWLEVNPSDSSLEVLRVLSALLDTLPPVAEQDTSLTNAALGLSELPALPQALPEPPASRFRLWILAGILSMIAVVVGWKAWSLTGEEREPFLDPYTPSPERAGMQQEEGYASVERPAASMEAAP